MEENYDGFGWRTYLIQLLNYVENFFTNIQIFLAIQIRNWYIQAILTFVWGTKKTFSDMFEDQLTSTIICTQDNCFHSYQKRKLTAHHQEYIGQEICLLSKWERFEENEQSDIKDFFDLPSGLPQ